MESIEVAEEGELVLGPDATQAPNELLGATIALIVVEPGLSDDGELAPEPAGYDIDRDAPLSEVVDRGDLFGEHRRRPRTGQDGSDHFQLACGLEQRMAERNRVVLILGAVAGGEANLRQSIVDAGLFGDLGEFPVVVDRPVRALLDARYDQTARNIRQPRASYKKPVLIIQAAPPGKAIEVGFFSSREADATLELSLQLDGLIPEPRQTTSASWAEAVQLPS